MGSNNINLIKEMNLNKVRSALRDIGTATKPRLAEATGLSVVTVNSLIRTLLGTGEVLPDITAGSAGGRPAAMFRYNSAFRLALIIYMHEHEGEDTAFYGVVNLQGEIIARERHGLANVCVDSFDSTIEQLIAAFPQIRVICFGIPGAEVNQQLVISDYENLREQSLSGHIGDKFHLPVRVENDINAAVMGYCTLHHIPADQCVVGLYFPDKYPPGAGIYLHGNVFKGRNGLAGEIKYLPFGVDWETFQYTPEALESVMIKTIQAFLCMYNPDRIVLYGTNIRQRMNELIRHQQSSAVERIMIPEIVTTAELNTDFESGIKQIALSLIDTRQDLAGKSTLK